MSTIADYSVFTKAFLTSKDVDFSKPYGKLGQDGSWGDVGDLKAFAVVPLALDHTLTPREALNFDWSKLGDNEDMCNRVSCLDADGNFIGNIVRIQPGVREGSIRLVAKVAVPAANEGDVEDIKVNTFVLLRTDSATSQDLPIAVATISAGYRLHKHLASGNDPLDDVENANYVSFTINHLNGYTSVDFNPDAYATYDDVANALSRGIDGLHIAFDTASGDLKLLDKDGNVLDQANLPIKTDVIIADGEEGYKYVKTDVKQDIHAAKAWMPEGKTAWKGVEAAPYIMQHAALVVGKGSTPASRVFVDTKSYYSAPISTESVQFEHVVIGDSIYMVVDKNETEATCTLIKVKGNAAAQLRITAGLLDGKVTHNDQQYPIKNDFVEVDVITVEDGVTTGVLVGPESPDKPDTVRVVSINGNYSVLSIGRIVSVGSTTASRVFVDPNSGSYPISTESVSFDHVVIDDSTYMVAGKNETETQCSLFKVKGKAEAPSVISPADLSYADLSSGMVTHNGQQYPITNKDVEVDVIKVEGATYVLAETGRYEAFQPRSLDGGSNPQIHLGIIVSGVSSTGGVVGITLEGTSMYTFEEGATTPSEFKDLSGHDVTWFGTKVIPAGYTLKYGLEAFVWTVKGDEYKSNDPFFQQLNASLLALGFHEGDDIALGTNLSILAPTNGASPLNGVDADEYIHGKDNKATREQEVDAQRAYAKEELVAWNAQHPELIHDPLNGTRISSDGVDIRKGSITLGCGSVGDAEEVNNKINYGIQMVYDSLDFMVSHTTGEAQFDENGNATNLARSTLLSIDPSGYISGAPTCLILAQVGRSSSGSPEFYVVRITTGFECIYSYDKSGSMLKIHDHRNNIAAVLNPNGYYEHIPAIIEVQAIYTHLNAETVPAQQMHTYIGEWENIPGSESGVPDHPVCIFSCNKIEEWMTAVGLADTNPAEGVKLYVVIRVY